MKKILRTTAQVILAVILVLALLSAASPVLANKGVENEDYSAIGTYRGFYREPENSLDVLFLGTSHAYCAFSPNELEAKTGLKSYNLASSQQSLLTSCYWLKEALRYQHPRAVVLDCFYCFYKVGNEGSVHKAFDWMNLSPVKVEAVNAACREFGGQLAGGNTGQENRSGGLAHEGAAEDSLHAYQFLLPALRYHDRWSRLTGEDLEWWKLAAANDEKGYCPRKEVYGKDFRAIPSADDDSAEQRLRIRASSQQIGSGAGDRDCGDGAGKSSETALNPNAHFAEDAPQEIPEFERYYLDEITQVCRKNGIRLILVKTPTIEWTPAQHEAVAEYAADQNIEFYDFNLDCMIQKCGYDFASDSADTMHANSGGAVKLTDAVGAMLSGGPDGLQTVEGGNAYALE